MKKLAIVCLFLMTTSTVTANACSGITIKGNSGKFYCMSKQKMNWYSAYSWCQNQGMKLIDIGDTCGSITSSCSELALSEEEQAHIIDNGGTVGSVWTGVFQNNYAVYCVNLDTGGRGSYYPNGSSGSGNQAKDEYALCTH